VKIELTHSQDPNPRHPHSAQTAIRLNTAARQIIAKEWKEEWFEKGGRRGIVLHCRFSDNSVISLIIDLKIQNIHVHFKKSSTSHKMYPEFLKMCKS